MKTFGKKILRRNIRKQIENRKETFDALVWQIEPLTKSALIKIQGTNRLIRAYYPENLVQTPEYLKPGNAVRVTRIGGNKNKMEISGHGQCIPSNSYGEGGVVNDPIEKNKHNRDCFRFTDVCS